MTGQEMLDEVRRSLGNRTDITDARYLLWINWALLDVCGMHRKRLFRPVRFHVLQETSTFSMPVVSGSVGTTVGDDTFEISGDTQADDYYNDMVVVITEYDETGAGQDTPDGLLDQVRLIKDFDGTAHVATITEDWDTNPDEYTSFEIYPVRLSIENHISIDPNDVLWAIQELEYAEDGSKITQDDWMQLINKDVTSVGKPGKFARHGDEVIFDTTHDDEYFVRVYYYRYPTLFTIDTLGNECELPVDWHEAVVMGAVFRGFNKLMEPDRASVAKEMYVDKATNRTDEFSFEASHVQRGMKIRRR